MDFGNQKIENSLNLAFDITEEERERSSNLNVGYNTDDETWEVIMKYSGNSVNDILENILGIEILELLNEYAIVTGTKEKIELLARDSSVEFIEKPKRLFFERNTGQLASCIMPIKTGSDNLQGKGVIVGILDSGIDFRSDEFRNTDGTTRILYLWDQTIKGEPPNGYLMGTEYNQTQINRALLQESSDKILSIDVTGHGTEVASIAVGNNGVASKADIIIVKLGTPQLNRFPRTTELMQGLDYLTRKSLELLKPLAVNISFGNTYGAHDGSSLLERFIDDISNYWKMSICVGAGNEGNSAGHTSGYISNFQIETVEVSVDRREVSFDLQIWKYYQDEIEINMIAPNNKRIIIDKNATGTHRYVINDTEVLVYYGMPSPYSVLQEIYFEFIPQGEYIDSGIWKIEFIPIRIVTGEYNMWLPSYGLLNTGTQFLNAIKENTLTIPSTASRVITVGAYDAKTYTYADFSGRGRSTMDPRCIKPDIVAPGVKVLVNSVNKTVKEVSGTSFATPFVTGSAALLMEWGIVEENDVFLYGEKMKAYLQKGAKQIEGFWEYPNEVVGYGILCLENSF